MTKLAPNTFEQYKGVFSNALLIDLYKQLLKPRMIEEKMLLLLRQGKISKWFSGIGQEAISVGCTAALDEDEKIFPMHRNLGVFTSRDMPLDRLFCQWQGKKNGYTKGRDRSFHFGSIDHNIIGMISHLGPQLSLAAGVALAYRLDEKPKISVAFTGDGATSQGEFHEAINTAAVWQLPVIFIVENNGYGLSTPNDEQFLCKNIADKGIGYGVKSATIDGNNILEVYSKIQEIRKMLIEEPQPFLLECMTFRMRGHEEASGTKYVPSELFETWKQKDPLDTFQKHLTDLGILDENIIESIRSKIKDEIDTAWKYTESQPEIHPDTTEEQDDLYAPHNFKEIFPSPEVEDTRFIDAISYALDQSMEKFPNLILMGQDIAEYGGAFKITQGFVEKYGKNRVRNTPLCESAIIGIGLGLSLENYKSMIEMQFADFVSCGFNQIVNNLAKLHYRWGHRADVVIRMPAGGGMAAGPFHSQCNEAWFTHTPGLKVIFPSSAYDAKGLLISAFEDPNPVLFFEHKAMYRTVMDEVPKGYYNIEIGKAKTVLQGDSISIITYGMGVHWALKTVEQMAISADIIDLRTLVPLDYATIDASVKKTGKVLILHEDTLFGGIGGEISAYISENLFQHLDAPVVRIASLDTPVPFAANLEQNFLPINRLKKAIEKIFLY
jgi:2-oxoisovalerate dehydrogenase E1 component